jgi:hypothetical protein
MHRKGRHATSPWDAQHSPPHTHTPAVRLTATPLQPYQRPSVPAAHGRCDPAWHPHEACRRSMVLATALCDAMQEWHARNLRDATWCSSASLTYLASGQRQGGKWPGRSQAAQQDQTSFKLTRAGCAHQSNKHCTEHRTDLAFGCLQRCRPCSFLGRAQPAQPCGDI